jgi:hypothetical protein
MRGSAGHASRSNRRGTRLAAKRKHNATTTTSSSGPITGMNSGIKSIGERTHSSAKTTAIFADLGTSGCPRNLRSVVAQAGRKDARSLADPGGSRLAKTIIRTHDAAITAIGTSTHFVMVTTLRAITSRPVLWHGWGDLDVTGEASTTCSHS